MVMFIISAIVVFLSSYFIASCLNKEKNVFGLIYIFLLSFANIVLTVETLSLFSAISQNGIFITNLILLCASVFVWNKQKRPLWSLNCKPFLKKVWLACLKDKYLLVIGLSYLFLIWTALFLIAIVPVVNADGEAYHVLRSVFWIGNGNLNHFDIGDFRNLHMPINSEILYLWDIIFTKKLVWFGAFSFCGYLISMISLYKILDFIKISIRPKLWALLTVSSFPAVIVQLSGTETDIIISGLVLASITLYWYAIKENKTKNIPIFMSALSYALAAGTKTTAFIAVPASAAFMIFLSVYYKKNNFYKPFLKFFGFACANFLVFSSYNYILNFINYGSIKGSENLIAVHTFNYELLAVPANFIKHLFLLVDFTGFKWGTYFGNSIVQFRDMILHGLNLPIPLDGMYSSSKVINQTLMEPMMGIGVSGMLSFIPSLVISFFAPIFKRNKKTMFLLAFGILFIINLISISMMLQFMVFSIRFITTFVVISAPILAYSYSKKNNLYKFILTLFILYYMLLVGTHLWARPYVKITKYLKKGYTITQVREISSCAMFIPVIPPSKYYEIHIKKPNSSCAIRNFIKENFDQDDRILYFPNNLDELLQLKMLDFKGYNIDYKMMEELEKIDLTEYDVIFSANNEQHSTVIKDFNPDEDKLLFFSSVEDVKKSRKDFGCRYIGMNKIMVGTDKYSSYPYSVSCKINDEYYNRFGFKPYKNLRIDNKNKLREDKPIGENGYFYNFYKQD